jgi:hypothetical protein
LPGYLASHFLCQFSIGGGTIATADYCNKPLFFHCKAELHMYCDYIIWVWLL